MKGNTDNTKPRMSHTSRKTGGLYHGDNKKKKGAERAYSDSEEKDKPPVRRPKKTP